VTIEKSNKPDLTTPFAEARFPALALSAGDLGGLHFSLVNFGWTARSPGVGKTAGLVYGMDLAGAFFGALSAGLLLLPILGIPKTLYFLAVLNLLAAVGLGWRSGGKHSSNEP
jgi:predicted membrane-bound spermidine synthase